MAVARVIFQKDAAYKTQIGYIPPNMTLTIEPNNW